MKGRTLKEIEQEMDQCVEQGDLGRLMDLVDEHGNTIDKMLYAACEGDIGRMTELEALGIDLADESFMKAAIHNDQMHVVFHLLGKGGSIEDAIRLAEKYDRPGILEWLYYYQKFVENVEYQCSAQSVHSDDDQKILFAIEILKTGREAPTIRNVQRLTELELISIYCSKHIDLIELDTVEIDLAYSFPGASLNIKITHADIEDIDQVIRDVKSILSQSVAQLESKKAKLQ